jgi:hypothetical protein
MRMELITSTKFYNSHTGEHIRTIVLYKTDIAYAIISEYADNYYGKQRFSNKDAVDYYNECISEIRKYLQSQGIIYHTK